MKIFLNQIEKRRRLEQTALAFEMKEGAKRMGLKSSHRLPVTDKIAIHQILQELKIEDYELENDELKSLEEQLTDIVHSHGIMMREVRLKDNWWKESTGPVLGRTTQGTLVALLPSWTGLSYSFTDAEGQRQKVTKGLTVLADRAYVFTKALPLRELELRDLLKFIWQSVCGSSLVYMLIASLLVVLLGMFTPMANKLVFDTVIPAGDSTDLAPIAGLLVGAGVATMLITYIRNMYILRVENIVEMNLHNAVMSRLFLLPPHFFTENSSGMLTSKLNNLTQLCMHLNEATVGALLGGALSVIYFIQVWIYGGSLIWPAVGLFALDCLCIVLYYRIVSHVRGLYTEQNDMLSGMECNLFAGIQKIKLTGSEVRAFTQWLNRYTQTARFIYNPNLQVRLYPALLALLNIGGLALIYWFAISDATHTSDFVAFSSAFGMMTAALTSITMQLEELAQIPPLMLSVKPILRALPEVESKSTQVKMLSGSIEVSHLSFRYHEDMPMVLDDLSLTIRPGEYVGVVGKSGCGKSTLMRLLLGFETPLRGSIFYDHLDLAKVDKSQLRRRIGSCLQNGSLFTGDLFHNITITAPWATHDDAWEALRQAYMYDEVKALPMGLHTIVSEGSGGFSGGQKQRLLIARALISKPQIIFFDEATSALDNISQKEVSDNLDKLHCTRVIIAHRLSTIRHCDRIIVLDKGRIAEQGTFEELMAMKGIFYNMSQRQL